MINTRRGSSSGGQQSVFSVKCLSDQVERSKWLWLPSQVQPMGKNVRGLQPKARKGSAYCRRQNISVNADWDIAMHKHLKTSFTSSLGSFARVYQEEERKKQTQLSVCHRSQWQALTTAQRIYCWAQWGHPVCLNWSDHTGHSLLKDVS